MGKIGHRSLKNWKYATPKEVYHQIEKFEPNDPGTKELFLLLQELIQILNSSVKDEIEKHESASYLRKRRVYAWLYPKPVVTQLIKVRKKLIGDSAYKDYHYFLPKIYNKKESLMGRH